MDARDFISVALRLSSAAGEADKRTSVGRAYYAAFHIALQLVERRCGVCLPKHQQHEMLSRCLSAGAHDGTTRAVGAMLKSLKEARRVADYELEDPSPSNAQWVRIQLQTMQQVIEVLDGNLADTEFSKLAESLRTHAKEIEGWELLDFPTG